MWLQFLHLISYGILLGSQVFQTFFNGILAYKGLSRPFFGVHQGAIFPVYFSLQSFLPVLVALTGAQKNQSMSPLNVLTPLYWCMTAVSTAGLINLIIFRPLTQEAVKARNQQGNGHHKLVRSPFNTKDRQTSPIFVSREKKILDRRFMYIHATSICINIGGLLATIQYGTSLAKLLD
ncbi:uncharacterized protein N7529_010402 [Penicillium soppii]|uniref:uncharacterized protein n=1 Tax=Penicillium soppii TaxID=69789 RepID=UPI0025493356|nr:uncharacterized protein N7529_010402 [Penicillium soppii]KAJ5856458.1 hypothetical protein N7529_010402 [Penicillium soppii]